VLHRGQLMQEGSRHRYLFRPPDTQEGFWDMVRHAVGQEWNCRGLSLDIPPPPPLRS
jgi:hypothetical protein